MKKAQKEITNLYQKEQLEYILGQIDHITNSIEDIQSQITWQRVNDFRRMMIVSSEKLKAASQEEGFRM